MQFLANYGKLWQIYKFGGWQITGRLCGRAAASLENRVFDGILQGTDDVVEVLIKQVSTVSCLLPLNFLPTNRTNLRGKMFQNAL